MKSILALTLLLIFSGSLWAQSHDGDSSVFPGDAIALSASSKVTNIVYEQGFIGDIVPPEDSDRLPVVKEVMALVFALDGEKYRFTHTMDMVKRLKEAMQLIAHPKDGLKKQTVQLTYYLGHSFRDGIHRISGYEIY